MKKKITIYIILAAIIALAAFTVWYYFYSNEAILENRLTSAIAEGAVGIANGLCCCCVVGVRPSADRVAEEERGLV